MELVVDEWSSKGSAKGRRMQLQLSVARWQAERGGVGEGVKEGRGRGSWRRLLVGISAVSPFAICRCLFDHFVSVCVCVARCTLHTLHVACMSFAQSDNAAIATARKCRRGRGRGQQEGRLGVRLEAPLCKHNGGAALSVCVSVCPCVCECACV